MVVEEGPGGGRGGGGWRLEGPVRGEGMDDGGAEGG